MAAPDLSLCSRSDVIDMGFGGETAEAIKLTRSDPTAWDPARLDLPIKMGSADVDTAAHNRFTLSPPPAGSGVEVYDFAIRKLTALRAVYYCWLTYCRGQAMPDFVKAAYDATEAELGRMRSGEQGVGGQKPPAARITGRAPVDLTSSGTFPRMSLEGWARFP